MERTMFKMLCLLILLGVTARATLDQDPWLPSLRCGPCHRLQDGSPAQCNPRGKYPCCNPASGWCGKTSEHCTCPGCVDYTKFKPSQTALNSINNSTNQRTDLWLPCGRCGPRFCLSDGDAGQCNPQGKYPCCNPESGWCGKTADHCTCKDCIDFSKIKMASTSPLIGQRPIIPVNLPSTTVASNIITADAGTTVTSKIDDENEIKILHEPDCRSLDLLVKLPIIQKGIFEVLSATHAYVQRCIGVNNKKKACVSIDKEINMEHRNVVSKIKGAEKEDYIPVNWIVHKKCKYQTREKCSFNEALARECHKRSTNHYYDEANCICSCIVQRDGKDTCQDTFKSASGVFTWLPIITFLLGLFTTAAILYFKNCRNKEDKFEMDLNDPDNETTPVIGFSDVEQPAEPPTPPAAINETDNEGIGFIHQDDSPRDNFHTLGNENNSSIGFTGVEQPSESNPTAALYETGQEKIGFIH